jgi:hypothetical protein
LKIPVFELPKSQIDMRISILKWKEEIQANVSIPNEDVHVDLNSKKDRDKKKSSRSRSDNEK